MRIAMAVLSDAVTVRENLINVLSGGITQLNRPEYPSPLSAQLAVLVEVDPSDMGGESAIHVEVDVIRVEDDSNIAQVEGELGIVFNQPRPVQLPIPLDFSGVGIPAPGEYAIKLRVADLDEVRLRFWAELVEVQSGV